MVIKEHYYWVYPPSIRRDRPLGMLRIEVSYRRVTRTFVHEHTGELVTLKAGKESLKVTPNHPVWVEGKGWTPAGDLKAGEEVVQADGGTVRLSAVETTPIRGPPVLVYNLEEDRLHVVGTVQHDRVLRCPVGTVKSRIWNGLARARPLMKEE